MALGLMLARDGIATSHPDLVASDFTSPPPLTGGARRPGRCGLCVFEVGCGGGGGGAGEDGAVCTRITVTAQLQSPELQFTVCELRLLTPSVLGHGALNERIFAVL